MPTSREGQLRTYRPLMDWWVLVILSVLGLSLVAAAVIALMYFSLPVKAVFILTISLLLLLIADRAFCIQYVVRKDSLEISSRLQRASYPYRAMRKIRPGSTRSLISFASHKRFALSGNCIVIEMDRQRYRSISVSPVERDAFLKDLLGRIDHERSARVAKK